MADNGRDYERKAPRRINIGDAPPPPQNKVSEAPVADQQAGQHEPVVTTTQKPLPIDYAAKAQRIIASLEAEDANGEDSDEELERLEAMEARLAERAEAFAARGTSAEGDALYYGWLERERYKRSVAEMEQAVAEAAEQRTRAAELEKIAVNGMCSSIVQQIVDTIDVSAEKARVAAEEQRLRDLDDAIDLEARQREANRRAADAASVARLESIEQSFVSASDPVLSAIRAERAARIERVAAEAQAADEEELARLEEACSDLMASKPVRRQRAITRRMRAAAVAKQLAKQREAELEEEMGNDAVDDAGSAESLLALIELGLNDDFDSHRGLRTLLKGMDV